MTTRPEAVEAAMAEVRLLPTRDHTPEAIAAIKAGGRVNESGRWDCANYDQRVAMRPDLNPNKRRYEQEAWKK